MGVTEVEILLTNLFNRYPGLENSPFLMYVSAPAEELAPGQILANSDLGPTYYVVVTEFPTLKNNAVLTVRLLPGDENRYIPRGLMVAMRRWRVTDMNVVDDHEDVDQLSSLTSYKIKHKT